MGQDHISRLAAPKSWMIKRKSTKWITRPIPGPHSLNLSMPLSIVLRDILEYAKTKKEIKKILNQKNILVDKVPRTEYKFPVGFMDVLEIPSLNEYYRIIFNKKGILSLVRISKEESNLKLLKIIRKSMVKKGKMQLTFHDGRTIILEKSEGNVGDTVLFNLTNKTINKFLPLHKDYLVYLNGGSHIGNLCKVKNIIRAKDLQKPKVAVEINGKEYLTITDYAFVVGKDKPDLSLEVKK